MPVTLRLVMLVRLYLGEGLMLKSLLAWKGGGMFPPCHITLRATRSDMT